MDHKSGCNHSNCKITSPNASVHQTLSEMDWERGIWNAAFSGDADRVQLLIDKTNNIIELVNSIDNSGYTALHYAARNGHDRICSILLQNGAQINASTRSGKATALHRAAAAGKENTVVLLIKSGARLDLQDADGKTPLHKAAENQNFNIMNILLEACPKLRNIRDNKDILAI
ncbi:ankyrin repeat domain-containing protein 39-like isoform X1 [Nymphalis io]|uniref:ankyrin repeat domain-containing protein 39-like isoform X1 n=1 Tax=Inachis io TaxID=171585 RepID=UPI0021678496|nr:ankyrin repeat domain-containing protein 39-like isoform X1 [Nymphalis io]